MLPIEQGEKLETFLIDTGDMIKLACESQVEEVRGQQTGFDPDKLHPEAQSWIAPKLCPISCATTAHSFLETAVTPVPLVLCP